MEDGFAIPAIEGGFAGGPDAAVEGCQEHILTTGEALLSFGNMAVDGGDHSSSSAIFHKAARAPN